MSRVVDRFRLLLTWSPYALDAVHAATTLKSLRPELGGAYLVFLLYWKESKSESGDHDAWSEQF